MSNLALRTITASVLLLAILLLLFIPEDKYFALTMVFLIFVCSYEWGGICKLAAKYNLAFSLVTSSLCLAIYYTGIARDTMVFAMGLMSIIWLAIFVLLCLYRTNQHNYILCSKPFKLLIGIVLLVGFWLSLVYLQSTNIFLLCLVIVTCIAFDTFAFLFGSKFGKHKLIPHVSPNKTWEGLLAGSFFAYVAAFTLLVVKSFFTNEIIDFIYYIPIILLAIVSGIVGDLGESLIKRISNVKDSGKILPGHGGILDRIDSYLAALPVSLFIVMVIG